MKFDRLAKLVSEMPDFALQGSKYKTPEGKGIKDFDLKALKENIVVYFMDRSIFFPPNQFLVYFMDTAESAKEMIDGNITPAIIHRAGLNTNGTFNTLWRSKNTDPRILGTIQGQIEDKIYIDFMTVRSKARRQSINSRMVDALKDEWPGKDVEYIDLTNQGKSFKRGYEGDVIKLKGFSKRKH